MMARLQSVFRMIFRRTAWEGELSDEIQFHIEQRANDIQRSGVPRTQAVRQARLEFGGTEGWRESCREAHGARWIDELARNVSYAGRSMRKRPGFTAVAVLSLALGIGANTAVFAFLHKLILTPLPVSNPANLQLVALSTPRGAGYRISYPMFEKLRDDFSLFSGVFAWSMHISELATEEHSEEAIGEVVSGGYFDALGIHPVLGRFIAEMDERSEAASYVVVLSYNAWQHLFGGDPGVLTRTVKLDGAPHHIIGVGPPDFSGVDPARPPDFYAPLPHFFRATLRTDYLNLNVMARLKPGVTRAAAQAELVERWPSLDADRRGRLGSHGRPDFLLLEDGSHGYSSVGNQYGRAVIALMALVAVVFLIACANLATLLFVRGAGRTGETSIRLALGASRGQIVRQWMTECLLLAMAGGICSLVAANWIARLLLYFVSEQDRPYLRFRLDAQMVLFAVGLTIAAGFLFGLLPALRSARVGAEAALRRHARSLAGGRGRVAEWMLVGQLAASLVLVTGAGLFARTLWNLNTAYGGFDRNVVYAVPGFYQAHWPSGGNRMRTGMNEIIAILKRSPHVSSVSIGFPPLAWGEQFAWVTVPGYVYAPEESNLVYIANGTPGYFQTLSIPLVAGRNFDERDLPASNPRNPQAGPGNSQPRPIIVSESFVRHYFNRRNPIGAVVTLTNRPVPQQIIGVVGNVKHLSIREPELDIVYNPLGPNAMANLLVRPNAGVDASAVEADVRAAIKAVLKVDVPSEMGRLEDAHQKSLRRDRLEAELSAAFGFFGVLLASIGLYGAMAHAVASRTREIGTRMALGADRSQIMRMVFQRSFGVTALGILLGWPLSFAGSRAIASLLFGVAPGDPVTFASAAAVVAAVSLLAAWRPAQRAACLDPMRALRYE
jgi:predicted permease